MDQNTFAIENRDMTSLLKILLNSWKVNWKLQDSYSKKVAESNDKLTRYTPIS